MKREEMLGRGESNTFKNDNGNMWHKRVKRVKVWFYNPSLETKYNGVYSQNGIIGKAWESKCCFRHTELSVPVRYPNENIL